MLDLLGLCNRKMRRRVHAWHYDMNYVGENVIAIQYNVIHLLVAAAVAMLNVIIEFNPGLQSIINEIDED